MKRRRQKILNHFENITGKVQVPEGHKHGTIFTVKKNVLKNLLKYSQYKVMKFIL